MSNVDWTKPVQILSHGAWRDAKVVHIFPGGRAILIWKSGGVDTFGSETESYTVASPLDPSVHNTGDSERNNVA